MVDPADFLARWSRLKQQARKPQAPANEAAPKSAPAPVVETAPAELPPIDSLTAESDYSVFMRPGVPEAARNAALQKLWRSDPVFANLDGLVEYGEDYAAAFKASAAVRTAYRVAKGMAGEEPPVSGADHQAVESAATPASDTSTQTGAAAAPTANDGSDVHQTRGEGWTDT